MSSSRDPRTKTVITIVIVLAAAIALFLWFYAQQNFDFEGPRSGVSNGHNRIDETQAIPLARITSNPEKYVDEEVIVNGSVIGVRSPRVIKISDPSTKEELTVLFSKPLNTRQREEMSEFLVAGAQVLVKGEIVHTTIAGLESTFDLDLTPELTDELSDRYILAANIARFTHQGNTKWIFLENAPPVTD